MTTHDVLVVGEALMDVVESDSAAVEHVGGSPANVALGLGRRGVDVALLTQIGPDERGRRIQEHLCASGVKVLQQSTSLERTSTAVAKLAGDGSASYTFDIAWNALPAVSEVAARVVHTGSIATFLAPGAATVRRLLDTTQADIVTFDPNVRPALVGERESAVRTFADTARRAQVVKMSDEDAEWLFPGLTPDDALDAVLGLGPVLAVVTLGSSGAILALPDARVRTPAPRVVPIDTIGAGDTFMASLIASFVSSGLPKTRVDLAELGVQAARAAAITVSRAGANLPWRNELEAGLREVAEQS
ncbi:carbohydrate kinase [Microbacterium marinum]|uniref:carbohydrate kinase family protein n=1 Tax=Microbacterium marinum TaxID=421115 RepID=UPI00385146C2